MKRDLIATVIASALALSAAGPYPVLGAAAQLAGAPTTPEATADSTPCPFPTGPLLAQGGRCCQRQGVCGCRNGVLKCCDGTTADGCPCRGDSPVDEAAGTEAL